MGCVALPFLLILLSGDVETNPGPLAPLARGPNLEKVKQNEGWTVVGLDNLIPKQQGRLMDRQLDKTDKTDETHKTDKLENTDKTDKTDATDKTDKVDGRTFI